MKEFIFGKITPAQTKIKTSKLYKHFNRYFKKHFVYFLRISTVFRLMIAGPQINPAF